MIKKYLTLFISICITLGYPGIVFLMALESCALPVPSEIVLGTAGFLSGEGKLNFYIVVLSATAGTVLGSSLLYLIGKKGGRYLFIKFGKYLLINKTDLERAEKWFKKYGGPAVFAGMMLPVIKTYIGFPPGASLMNYKKFLIFAFLGSIIYNFIVTYLGLELGRNIRLLMPYFHKFGMAAAIFTLILIILYLYFHIKRALK